MEGDAGYAVTFCGSPGPPAPFASTAKYRGGLKATGCLGQNNSTIWAQDRQMRCHPEMTWVSSQDPAAVNGAVPLPSGAYSTR